MSTSSLTLEDAIRQSGEGWVLDSFSPKQDAMAHIFRALDSVQREANDRLAASAPAVSEAALIAEFLRNPQRVRGFFQALGGTRTPQMLLMVWRIIQGMEVREMELQYRKRKAFEVRVVLESPDGEMDAPYVSKSIQDFALFRHFGILEIGGAPVFDGFYALKLRGASSAPSN